MQCPDTCPACGVDLKAEGYPTGHQTDEGEQCTFTWGMRQAISDGGGRMARKQHPGSIVTVTIGGVQIAKRDADGNLIYTCCEGKGRP